MRYKYDTDFAAWRKSAKAKLEELLGLPLEKCDDCFTVISEIDCGEYKRIDFEFQSEKDCFVRGTFLAPANIGGKLPCAICLQGHTTGMHISLGEEKFEGDERHTGESDFARRAVKEGICAVVIEQRYMGYAGRDEGGKPACLNAVCLPALLLGRTAIGERVWDVQRLIDVLESHFSEYVDTEKILCIGNSGGGTATFYSSCLEERIKISVPSCSVCKYEDSIIAMWHCPCNYVPGILKYFDMGDLGALIAPRKLVVVLGEKDDIFPIEPAKETYEITKNIYRMLGKEEDCSMVVGDGGHKFYPDDAWPVIHKYLGEL